MAEIEVPCPTCAATGESTHEDRHAGTDKDTCRTCGGRRTIPARPGESRETSWPFAVPGAEIVTAPQNAASSGIEGLVDDLIHQAKMLGLINMGRSLNGLEHLPTRPDLIKARAALLSALTPSGGDLAVLSRKVTKGEWYVESEKTDGSYGFREGYHTSVICTDAESRHGQPGIIFEGSNSNLAEIEEEHDEDQTHAWDAVARANADFIVALVNAYRSGRLVERDLHSPSRQEDRGRDQGRRSDGHGQELNAIREMLLEGQGDDDGSQILPDFQKDMTTHAMVAACVHLLERRRDALDDANSGGEAPGRWQPIETVPRDGSDVLLLAPDGLYTAAWLTKGCSCVEQSGWHTYDGHCWHIIHSKPPTAWMPEPPSQEKSGGGDA